jgi:hypothetical protein
MVSVLPAAHNNASPALLPLIVFPIAGLGFICGFWFAMGKCRKKTFPLPGWEGKSQKAVKNEHFYVIQSVEIRSKKFTKVLLF